MSVVETPARGVIPVSAPPHGALYVTTSFRALPDPEAPDLAAPDLVAPDDGPPVDPEPQHTLLAADVALETVNASRVPAQPAEVPPDDHPDPVGYRTGHAVWQRHQPRHGQRGLRCTGHDYLDEDRDPAWPCAAALGAARLLRIDPTPYAAAALAVRAKRALG